MASERLATATSPYLRMHAANPVDWHAWGEEAFAEARARDCPIFLSVGYFTCHWCHVMERESFASTAVAEQLNRDFVSIKLDREERPDIDRLYMSYVQSATGSGGWPMSVFLTPELKPFYGGTYFPPQPRHGLPGFGQLLEVLARAWREERPRLLEAAEHARQFLARAVTPAQAPDAHANAPSEPEAAAPKLLASVWPRLWRELRESYDASGGGFGGAPKFPRPAALGFLLRYARVHAEAAAEATGMARHTLEAMARGGMHDQLGGGFHRYATDAGWRVPHFEKMLYDQAQLAVAYLQAWQATGDAALAAVARSTCDYVLRELTSPEGLFYCAQDADSVPPGAGAAAEAREGAYYLWEWNEIESALGAETREFAAAYGVETHGNVPLHLDPQGEFGGRNILYLDQPPAPDQAAALDSARALLLARRGARPRPPLDDKTLTAWNALMITALARAGAALDDARYCTAAARAARVLLDERWEAPSGRLLRTAGVEGFAEDYAFLIQALLDLYQATFDAGWLETARLLQQAMEARLAAPGGGYYATAAPDALGLRQRDEYDGAEPTASSVALGNLLRLGDLEPGAGEAESGYRAGAGRLLASFAATLEAAPQALAVMACSLEAAASPPRTLRFTGRSGDDAVLAMARAARARFLPGWTLVAEPGDGPAQVIACSGMRCDLPVSDAATLENLLDRLARGTTPEV